MLAFDFVCSIDLELLSSSIDVESHPEAKAELEKLHKLTGSINTVAAAQNDEDEAMMSEVCLNAEVYKSVE